jgi:hypothetical protein
LFHLSDTLEQKYFDVYLLKGSKIKQTMGGTFGCNYRSNATNHDEVMINVHQSASSM